MLLGAFLALGLRSNIMVATALTLITNPFTVVPIYYADYQVGGWVMDIFGKPDLSDDITPEMVELYGGGPEPHEHIGILQRVSEGWLQTMVGALILGIFLSLILHAIYLLTLRFQRRHGPGHSFHLLGGIFVHKGKKEKPDAEK